VPDPDISARRQRIVLEGDVPSPISPPSGCRFHPRCRYATTICTTDEPPLTQRGSLGHLAACHHPLNSDAGPADSAVADAAVFKTAPAAQPPVTAGEAPPPF
jgi:oligopeptide/dipeptide ABC transporter ATP-binding protein